MKLFSVNKSKSNNKKKTGVGKKVLVVTGMMLALFMAAPAINSQAVDNMLGVETSYAAELPYSTRWETQADGSWKYKLDNGSYATGWIHDEVDGNWYLMDFGGVMQSGVYKSYGKYYLLSQNHDGHFGHLVKSGEVYNGITISASTNADDEGALSSSSIIALRNIGINVDSVQDISGTQHVSNGQVTSVGSNAGQSSSANTETPAQNQLSQNSGVPDWMWDRMNNCNNIGEVVDDATGWKAGDSRGLPNLH